MPDPNSLPLYRQVSDILLRDIAAGRLLEGERLRPEREMAASYRVSVGTLRKALADLTARGHLERRQGSGNYVRHTRGVGGVYAFFRLDLLGGGGRPTAEGLDVRRMAKPADAPEFGPSSEAHRIRRIRSLSDIPCVAEEIWLDASWAEEVTGEDIAGALYLFYASRLGLRIARAEDRVGIGEMPDWGTAAGPAAGAPCGFVERISWDQHGQRAEYSRSWFDPSKARYVARMQ
ncbi:GntR family transcriptional regulator [Oceaniglobus roseus]|uniref:GntR family transcriptional regulator n=1 Tax=Oceaniglobus roseus TaxID=1737570 RepID=UPI000C7EC244|nr:GntR family transcriptional regulator [Kandeliimicrobium roseum]